MLSHYVVHWAGYQAHLQSACCDQFLSEKFVDVTLAVDSGLIKCHRVILSAASGYFHQLLAQHDSAHPIIFMRDMQYWELIALVDFMYRGEVTVEADRLEQLMWSASQLQIHGLAACLKACLQRSSGNNTSTNTTQLGVTAENEQISAEGDGEMEDDSQESGEIGDTGIPPSLSKLCELNCELELRPITPSSNSGHTIVPSGGGRVKRGSLPPPPLQALNKESVPAAQKDVVKEEIEFIEEKPQLSPAVLEPAIQIQSVFSECSTSNEKGEASDDGNDIEEEVPTPATADSQKSDRTFRQFLLLSSMQGSSQSQESTQTLSDYNKLSLHDTPLYKRYSPRSLEQALRDLKTGRFRSIRACARHHGIPMTTLRYRAKGKTQRPAWLGQ